MRNLSYLVGLGALAMFLVGADGGGCFGGGGPTDDPDGGITANYPQTCTLDTECLSTEVCHPIGLVCVKNCADDATVCGEDSCVETTAGTVSAFVCKCDTCSVTGEVCSKDLDDVCETACTSNDDCKAFTGQDRECNGDGICVFKAVGPCDPACTGGKVCDTNINTCIDACTATSCDTSAASKCSATSGLCEACSVDADCAIMGTGYKCDTTGAAPVCVSTAVSCTETDPAPGLNGGQSTCNYGEVCSAAACVANPLDGSCSDYSWNMSLKGPVIVTIDAQSFQTSNGPTDPYPECGNSGPKIHVVVDFYAPDGLTYDSFKDFLDPGACGAVNPNPCLGHFNFTKTDGSVATPQGASYARGLPQSGAKYGSFTAGLCIANNLLTGRAVWIVDGNGAAGNAACL